MEADFLPKWMTQLIVFMTGLRRKYPDLENKTYRKFMSLNEKILEAHQNKNLSLLVELYQEAAKNVSKAEEENFFLVQAYTFALEVSHSQVLYLRRELVSRGVEE